MKRPTVVVICGSTRFPQLHLQAMKDLTLAGKVVLPCGLMGHQEGLDMHGPVKSMLDELHLRKIDMADEVFVINPMVPTCSKCGRTIHKANAYLDVCACGSTQSTRSPYIGQSTRREIEYAQNHPDGKTLLWLVPPPELPPYEG